MLACKPSWRMVLITASPAARQREVAAARWSRVGLRRQTPVRRCPRAVVARTARHCPCPGRGIAIRHQIKAPRRQNRCRCGRCRICTSSSYEIATLPAARPSARPAGTACPAPGHRSRPVWVPPGKPRRRDCCRATCRNASMSLRGARTKPDTSGSKPACILRLPALSVASVRPVESAPRARRWRAS